MHIYLLLEQLQNNSMVPVFAFWELRLHRHLHIVQSILELGNFPMYI